MFVTIHNLIQSKLRTFFTILGIAIGIVALTIMGAMSERINHLVSGAIEYYNSRIIVQPRSGIPGGILGPPLTINILKSIKRLPGVKAAFPSTFILYQEQDDEIFSFNLGFPPLIKGVDVSRLYYKNDPSPIDLYSGQLFRSKEKNVAVIGFDIAKNKKLNINDMFRLGGRDYRVLGIMSQSLTIRDNFIFIPLEEAQEILAELLPYPLNLDPYALVSEIEVYPHDLAEASYLATKISQQIKGVRALPPGEIKRLYEQKLKIFIAIAISSAVIAVIVGGLSIFNTMMMAVSERTKEIGVKKALGASNINIMLEFITEAGIIGIIGGVGGLAMGQLIIHILNENILSGGIILFVITPRLIVFVLLFAVLLGILAGLFPALVASRRKPINALRAD
jgi:putative ABC transport system permease protein